MNWHSTIERKHLFIGNDTEKYEGFVLEAMTAQHYSHDIPIHEIFYFVRT